MQEDDSNKIIDEDLRDFPKPQRSIIKKTPADNNWGFNK
jgi:hypothetical protein